MKQKYKTMLFGVAACFTAAALALSLSVFSTQAADCFVSWKAGGKKKGKPSVEIQVQLMEEERFDESATFQIVLDLKNEDKTSPDEEDCEFQFSQEIKGNSKVAVRDWRYMEGGEIWVLVSGRKDADGNGGVLKKDKALTLGSLYVESDQDVTVTIVADQCKAVDERGNLSAISQLGSTDRYVIKAEKPEESQPSSSGSGGETEESPDETTPGTSGGEKPGDEEESTKDTTSGDKDDDPGETSGTGNGGSGENPGESTARPGGSSGGGSRGSGGSGGGRGQGSYDPIESSTGPGLAVEADGSWEAGPGGAWRFRFTNGAYAKSQWIYVQGLWYRIGEDGIMLTGWFEQNGLWYFLKPYGAMATGWRLVDNCWYFLGDNGIMRTGWRQVEGKWYYLNTAHPVPKEAVDPATGLIIMTTQGQLPYGAMYADAVTPDGYKVDANGVWIP